MDRLSAFGEQFNFSISVEADTVLAVAVPCLLRSGAVSTCTITKSFDAETGKPNGRIGGAVHAVRIATDEALDGRVYHADGTSIGRHLRGDDQSWSEISIKKGSRAHPEEDGSARDVLHRYAKQIVGAVSAAGEGIPPSSRVASPFRIPNTFEERADIGPVQDRIRGQRVGLIGLGGTGAYILDLLAKTPVREIHLLDSDSLGWHNLMRAPGAPTSDEIRSQHEQRLRKVDYYYSKYASLREGIQPHAVRVDSSSVLAEFLATNPIDYAFVCIDQLTDSDWPRQDVVYAALSEARIPFIDSGVSITVEDASVSGSVTTTAYAAGSLEWKNAIPNAKAEGDAPGYRNVQLPEVNGLAAALAVMEWRRQTGQYVTKSTSFLHKFRIEKPHIAYGPVEED